MTGSPTHLTIGYQKCCICYTAQPLEEYYRPGAKYKNRRKSCNTCAAKAKEAHITKLEKLYCSSCNQRKPRELFFDDKQPNTRRKTCLDCRMKNRKGVVQRHGKGWNVTILPGEDGAQNAKHLIKMIDGEALEDMQTGIQGVSWWSREMLGVDAPVGMGW